MLVTPGRAGPGRGDVGRAARCVLRAQDRSGLRAGDSLLVSARASTGLLSIAAAHARGGRGGVGARAARRPARAGARAWGAERHGNELVDVAIVCTPKPEAIAAAAEAVAPGGTLCLYAPPAPDDAAPTRRHALFLRELTVTASYSAGPGDMRAALELIAGGEVDPKPLVSRTGSPLEQTAPALELQRRGEALKAVVHP